MNLTWKEKKLTEIFSAFVSSQHYFLTWLGSAKRGIELLAFSLEDYLIYSLNPLTSEILDIMVCSQEWSQGQVWLDVTGQKTRMCD